MKKGYVVIVALMLIVIGFAAYDSMEFQGSGYTDVSPERAYGIIQEQNPVILDVRTQQEYQNVHIPGAINIPVEGPNELKNDYTELPKDRPIVIYCRTGRRSVNAAELLASKGYDQLYNVEGGITRWTSQDLPVTE